MICALRSSFCRFVRTGLLAKVLIFSPVLSLIIILHTCAEHLMMYLLNRPRFLDNSFIIINCLKLVVVIPFAAAVFCTVFTGNDFSSRTVNNRIATGIPRFAVYFADLMVSLFATVLSILIAVFVFVVFAKTVPVKENIELNRQLAEAAGSVILICMAFTSFFVVFQFFFSNRLLAVIVSALIILGLMMSASAIYSMLEEPYRYYVKIDEETDTYEWRINKEYIGGTPRKILTFVYDVDPYSVMNDLIEGGLEVAYEEDLSKKNITSGAVIVLSTAAGFASVKKKEFA